MLIFVDYTLQSVYKGKLPIAASSPEEALKLVEREDIKTLVNLAETYKHDVKPTLHRSFDPSQLDYLDILFKAPPISTLVSDEENEENEEEQGELENEESKQG